MKEGKCSLRFMTQTPHSDKTNPEAAKKSPLEFTANILTYHKESYQRNVFKFSKVILQLPKLLKEGSSPTVLFLLCPSPFLLQPSQPHTQPGSPKGAGTVPRCKVLRRCVNNYRAPSRSKWVGVAADGGVGLCVQRERVRPTHSDL